MDNEQISLLIKRMAAGDSGAFRDLLDAHYAIIYRMAYRFCGNATDAEDVTQMACIKLAQSAYQFGGGSAFTTWLYTVVMNTARDWQRSQNRHTRGAVTLDIAENKVSTAANPEQNLEQKQQLERIAALPEAERDAIWLVFGEGLSHKDAALVLGCAEGTISYRIHEARKKLAEPVGGRKHG